jgi:hypothetical protein
MKLYHFSLRELPVETHLVGLKGSSKSSQRVGQKKVDEIFEAIRKQEFPEAPSIFTSLWTSDRFDPAIPRKQFKEDPQAENGFFYEVLPEGNIYQIEPHWEVEACRSVTWSELKGGELNTELERLARLFWLPELVEDSAGIYLCPEGAVIRELVRTLTPGEMGV